MQIVDIPIELIEAPEWNSNQMDAQMYVRLKRSISRFDLVVPLVVRITDEEAYETIGGAQRLTVMRELAFDAAPCVIVEADDAEARLLALALNSIEGEDDLGLKAEALRQMLTSLPQDEVLSLLPETAESLEALASLGQEDMASHLQAWQRAQAARLKHFQVQLTQPQMRVVAEAMERILPKARELQSDSPNLRGTAVYLLCKLYLEAEIAKERTR